MNAARTPINVNDSSAAAPTERQSSSWLRRPRASRASSSIGPRSTSGVTAGGGDGLDEIAQGASLLGDQVAVQVDDGLDGVRGGVARGARADLTDVRGLERRLDGDGGDVALVHLVHARQEV